MKHTKVCPKCGSGDIAEIEGGVFSPLGTSGTMEIDAWKTARVDRWICCNCGYSETWIEPEKLQKIRKRWEVSH